MEGCSEYVSAAGFTSAIKSNARDRVRKEGSERKRNILYLIANYLQEQNLTATLECLHSEAQLHNDVEVCDNIDLDTILQEYQSYYNVKFNRPPKITKIVKQAQALRVPVQKPSAQKKRSNFTVSNAIQPNPDVFHMEVKRLFANADAAASNSSLQESVVTEKPLNEFPGHSNEWREMADVILKEIVPKHLGIAWNDCIGLQSTIELLKEALVYPVKYPEFFSGLLYPWKGVLLYGSPGTGKTLLARSVACETGSTFFNMTGSCFVNKWRGESEKMIKVLFDLARFYAPSTIFIDELDAFACEHANYHHDASRRFKTELLTQIDGVLREDDNKVFVLATTNRPWDLDAAILRRFEKRILVDIPCERIRAEMYEYYFSHGDNLFEKSDYAMMGKMSVDFSGSDVKVACREACMRKLRERVARLENEQMTGDSELCGPKIDDVIEAIESVRPVTNARLQGKYLKWRDEFGCR